MKTATKILTALSVAAAVTVAAFLVTVARAEDAPGRARPFLGERLAQLGVTDAQKEQVHAILRKYQPTVEPMIKQLVAERRKLRDTIRAESVDEKAIRAQAAKAAGLEADLAVARAQVAHEIRPVLTADQIKKLEEMQIDFDDRIDSFLQRVAKRIAAD